MGTPGCLYLRGVYIFVTPVRLVRFQPDHIFPHSWLPRRCQLAPLLGGRPRNAPKHTGTMLKLARWLRTVQQNCSASLPSTFRSYKRTISLASFTCEGCGFRPIIGLGGLCSIFHRLCYSNMLEIIPIMLETMPQICLLCSNYAHNFWKEQMLFVFRNLNRPRANPLSIT